MFLDKTRIKILSGKGGNGIVAWRREKYVDKGGPAGGNGGKGGDIYLVATEDMSTLMDFQYQSVFKAENGENGYIKTQHGKCGKDLKIRVPVGTVVKDIATGKIIADLNQPDQTIMVAQGGRGGRGNACFATSQKRAPQFCEPGENGIERTLELELKLLADVGLLGMPNAGKSTLISSVSSAKPKIADYPFTTLVPNLGVVKKDSGDGYVIADIPGLIEGASEGIGLGHEFLRHVERCRFLIHLVDLTEEDPIKNYKIINEELKKQEKESSLFKSISSWFSSNKKDKKEQDGKETKNSKPSKKNTANKKKNGLSLFEISNTDTLETEDNYDEAPEIMPAELKLSFQPNRAEISGHTLRWIHAFADNARDNSDIYIEIRIDGTNSFALQQKRLNLLSSIFANRGVDFRKVNIIFTAREPNSFIIRNIKFNDSKEIINKDDFELNYQHW